MGRPNPSSWLTLGDFARTGRQDCANAIDADQFMEAWRDDRSLTAEQVVEQVWKEDEADIKEHWLEQQGDDFDGLDPESAYRAWRDAWKATAVGYVRGWIKEEREEMSNEWEPDITEGMARALWVTAYADWVEELPAKERRELAAGPGEDWTDVAPDSPPTAYDAAAQLTALFEKSNGCSMTDLLERALAADKKKFPTGRYAELFGHYMAMQALGHGVSWFDDHKSFKITFPRFEAMTGDGQSLDWSPMSQKNPSRRRR